MTLPLHASKTALVIVARGVLSIYVGPTLVVMKRP